MKAQRLTKALYKAGKRFHLVGDLEAGVIAALDVEDRLFTVLDGEVLNRVNLEAIAGQSTRDAYLNPGGDGLWPAPEGTTLGYQYSTGEWRVPPGLTAARYIVTHAAGRCATIAAEVDMVNNQGLGIPTVFQRKIKVAPGRRSVAIRVVESITHLGRAALRKSQCLLAPWSLCQFDSGPDCEVVFPCRKPSSVWDLYEDSSGHQRTWKNQLCSTKTDGAQRYQIAIDAQTPWIEYRDPRRGLAVRRKAGLLPKGHSYIDIRDAAPDTAPIGKGVRYSIYSDVSRFMEIEAVGGCPSIMKAGETMSVQIDTRYHFI